MRDAVGMGRIGTHDKRLDRGRHIFTFDNNVILLANSSQLLLSLFSDIRRRTPSDANHSWVRGGEKLSLI